MTRNPEFSNDLKILAGEWLTYCALSCYFEDMFADEDFYDFDQFSPDLTLEQKFEKCPMNPSFHALFSDAYLFMEAVGITQFAGGGNLKAKCTYSEIPNKIRLNRHKSNYSISYAFILIAGYRKGYFKAGEMDFIAFEKKCLPLVQALETEGFCKQNADRIHWTSKIRPYLESKNIWRERGLLSEEEELLNSLTDDLKAEIHSCAERKDLVSACLVLTRSAGAKLSVAKNLLENHMYPKIWKKPEEPNNDIVFKWYGPT